MSKQPAGGGLSAEIVVAAQRGLKMLTVGRASSQLFKSNPSKQSQSAPVEMQNTIAAMLPKVGLPYSQLELLVPNKSSTSSALRNTAGQMVRLSRGLVRSARSPKLDKGLKSLTDSERTELASTLSRFAFEDDPFDSFNWTGPSNEFDSAEPETYWRIHFSLYRLWLEARQPRVATVRNEPIELNAVGFYWLLNNGWPRDRSIQPAPLAKPASVASFVDNDSQLTVRAREFVDAIRVQEFERDQTRLGRLVSEGHNIELLPRVLPQIGDVIIKASNDKPATHSTYLAQTVAASETASEAGSFPTKEPTFNEETVSHVVALGHVRQWASLRLNEIAESLFPDQQFGRETLEAVLILGTKSLSTDKALYAGEVKNMGFGEAATAGVLNALQTDDVATCWNRVQASIGKGAEQGERFKTVVKQLRSVIKVASPESAQQIANRRQISEQDPINLVLAFSDLCKVSEEQWRGLYSSAGEPNVSLDQAAALSIVASGQSDYLATLGQAPALTELEALGLITESGKEPVATEAGMALNSAINDAVVATFGPADEWAENLPTEPYAPLLVRRSQGGVGGQ